MMPASDTVISPRVLDVLRFAVPWDAAVAVIGRETDGLAMRRVVPLVPDGRAPDDLGDRDAVARLAALRAEGCEFLVAGASAFGWLDERPQLKDTLENVHRLVDRDPGACAVYALHDAPAGPGSDGLPLPPADMIRMTSGMYRRASDAAAMYRRYDEGGTRLASFIRELLAGQGTEMPELGALLDFGCGCGRVVRHWADLPGDVHGSDYNPNLVRWCADNLPFAEFAVNGDAPPLPYADDTFGFLYSISIFTHLDEPLQVPWITELVRVTRPGGLILITVSGDVYARRLPAWERLREPFEAGRLVVRRPERTGSNSCSVLHPPEYVRDTLTAGLDVLTIVPGVRETGWQDAILMRAPER
jgi:SAM-dependent methyltransferase